MQKTIFIALDGNYSLEDFISIAKNLSNSSNEICKQNNIKIAFKIGLEFFCSFGFYGVNKIEELESDIFLDLKLFDISNTVLGALNSVYKSSQGFIKYTTLHLLNGNECLEIIQEQSISMKNKIKILGVSLLTSLDDKYLKEQNFNYKNTNDCVVEMIKKSQDFIDGCICSPLEANLVRNSINKRGFEIITPGVQMTKILNDQKRVLTPFEAFNNGATGVVIGRAIMNNENKINALNNIIKSLM